MTIHQFIAELITYLDISMKTQNATRSVVVDWFIIETYACIAYSQLPAKNNTYLRISITLNVTTQND